MESTDKAPQRRRILRTGTVISDRMDKTITVRFDRTVKHPLYEKYVRRKTEAKAHDPSNEAKTGDLVEVCFTRPLSKTKCWRLVRIVKPGPGHIAAKDAASAAGGGA